MSEIAPESTSRSDRRAPSTDPLVSVIVPTCNRSRLLVRALRSVFDQTFADFEVIVGVDGSTDDTVAALQGIDDPRLRWFTHENCGVSATRNACLQLARGRWIAFLDDDNVWKPDYLAQQLAHGGPVDIVCCLTATELPDGTYGVQMPPPSHDSRTNLRHGWYPFVSATVMRRSVLERFGGFSTRFSVYEDSHLWTRLALTERWGFVLQPLLLRPAHGGPRLSQPTEGTRSSAIQFVQEVGGTLRRELGWRAYEGWFRWVIGEISLANMRSASEAIGRRAGWEAITFLAPYLPWSARSMARPSAMLLLGPVNYSRIRTARAGRPGRGVPSRPA